MKIELNEKISDVTHTLPNTGESFSSVTSFSVSHVGSLILSKKMNSPPALLISSIGSGVGKSSVVFIRHVVTKNFRQLVVCMNTISRCSPRIDWLMLGKFNTLGG